MSDSKPLKDALILHFGAYHDFIEEEEVPHIISPSGISESLNINLNECYEYLSEFEKKGLIFKDVRRIKRYKNKREVYFLTELGRQKEERIRDDIKDRNLKIEQENEIKEVSFDELERYIDKKISPAKLFLNLERESKLDISSMGENEEAIVGREDELDELKNLLRKVKEDRCRAVFIEGETGMGKSRLILRLNKIAKNEGFKVLNGYCQRDISDPYFPFKKALDQLEDVEKELKDFFPSDPNESEIEDMDALDARRKTTFFETVRFLKTLSSQQPLLISIDDMQWADKGTLKLFHYMTDKLENSPVLLATAYRPGEIDPGHQLKDTFQRMARTHLRHRIKLTPLGKDSTEELMRLMLGIKDFPDELVSLIHEKTKGNPLFIKEIIRQMIEENKIDTKKGKYPDDDDFVVPDVIEPVIRKRVKQLDDETQKVLQLGSVIGEKIPLRLLQECSEIDEMKLLDHIDIIVENDIWKETQDQEKYEFEFDHSLIKDTIYEGLGDWLERRKLHKKVAKGIESIYEGDSLENLYPDLAHHYEEAENILSSFKYYVKAAKKAEGVYAHEDAVEMYKAAVKQHSELEEKKGSQIVEIEDEEFEGEKIEILDILERISKVCNILGKYDKSRKYLQKGLNKLNFIEKNQNSLKTDLTVTTQKMKLLRKIGETRLHQGKYENVLNTTERGLSLEKKEDELNKKGKKDSEPTRKEVLKQNKERCKLLSIKGRALLRVGDYQESLEIFRKEKRAAEELKSIKGVGQAYHDLGMIYLQKGDLEKAKRNLKEAINIWNELKEMRERSKSLNNLGVVYHLLGSFEDALEYWEKGLSTLQKIGDKRGTAVLLNNIGELQHQKGELERALDKYKKSLDLCQKIGIMSPETMALINMGNLHKDRGELKEAYEHYQKALKISEDIVDKIHRAEALDRIGDIYFLEGKLNEALEKYDTALHIREEIGVKRGIGASLGRIGNVHRKKGKTKEAVKKYSKSIELSNKAGNRVETVKNLCGITRAYLDEEHQEKASQKIEEAQNIVDEVGLSLLSPRVKLVKGLVYHEENKFDEAEAAFEEALQISEKLGLKIDQTRVLFELAKLLREKEGEKKAKEALDKMTKLASDIGMTRLKRKTEKMFKEAG